MHKQCPRKLLNSRRESRIGGERVFEVSKVDKVIEEICVRIITDSEKEDGKVLAEEIKALAELVSARAKYN